MKDMYSIFATLKITPSHAFQSRVILDRNANDLLHEHTRVPFLKKLFSFLN